MRQADLFSEVLHSYALSNDGVLSNHDLYNQVAHRTGITSEDLSSKVPIGKSGQRHNLFKRHLRWHQQTLKSAGVLEHVDGARAVWRLTTPAAKDLNEIKPGVAVIGFSTKLGVAILGSCDSVFDKISAPIVLCLTSPPYPLAKARSYGNVSEEVYVDWICRTLEPVIKNLVPGGSIALNVSNDVYLPGLPARSLYREYLVIALCKRFGLYKIDEIPWVNESKAPAPVQWASKERFLLNVAWEPVYWFSNSPLHLHSDNRRILKEHTDRHLALIRGGGEQRVRVASDGAYTLRQGSYGNHTEGAIQRNVFNFGHACADQQAYKRAARGLGLPAHGAPMPLALAKLIIKYMTKPGDLVCDPFAGSNTTAKAAEILGRRWLSTEKILEYVMGSATRFQDAEGFRLHLAN